ncbi:MAG TPA: hypothetical protein VEX39_11615 [Thermoleophilaceae bacterium]|nr:hypothetical protein [Thermoleophilaceae bacterium]
MADEPADIALLFQKLAHSGEQLEMKYEERLEHEKDEAVELGGLLAAIEAVEAFPDADPAAVRELIEPIEKMVEVRRGQVQRSLERTAQILKASDESDRAALEREAFGLEAQRLALLNAATVLKIRELLEARGLL